MYALVVCADVDSVVRIEFRTWKSALHDLVTSVSHDVKQQQYALHALHSLPSMTQTKTPTPTLKYFR